MMDLFIPAGAILGGLAFRVRGGLFDVGSTAAGRAIWALTMTALALLAAWSEPAWFRLLALAPVLYLGALPGWWADSLWLGPDVLPGSTRLALNAARGLVFTLPAAPVLWWVGAGWWWGFAGLASLPCYVAGDWLAARFPRLGRLCPPEWIYGAALGAALVLAIH